MNGTSRWTAVVAALAVVAAGVFFLLWLEGRRPPVSPPPTTPPGEQPPAEDVTFTLNMSDEHLGSWMPVDNGFTLAQGQSARHRSGFLLQLGRYFNIAQGQKVYLLKWDKVRIIGTVDTRELGVNDFDWINVVADASWSNHAPIDRNNARLLYPEANVQTKCKTVDECVDPLGGTANQKCFCPGYSCDAPGQLKNVGRPCLRLRTVHAHFDAEKLITFWEGDNGYKVTAAPTSHHRHNSFSFSTTDDVTLEVYKGNAPVTLKIGTLRQIDIVGGGHDTTDLHGEMHEPPLGSDFGI